MISQRNSRLKRLYKYILAPVAQCIVLIIRLLSPLVVVRFAALDSYRIGSLAMLTELYLCRRQAGLYKKNSFDFFFYDTLPVSNYQLNKMWKRLLLTVNLPNLMPLVVRLNRAFPGYKKHEIKLDSFLADPVNLHTIYPTHLAFLPDEKNRGKD